jgi:2-polyprenyl-3-methyl-5-hydroxy-6-metoxy-1,4-benzoquinol methylase
MVMTQETKSCRAANEIAHGRWLAAGDTELTWGWATPAGQLRAKRRAQLVAEGSRLGPGVRALEIGCGTGLFTEQFASSGASILAVDISEELLVKARERSLPANRVEFQARPFEVCHVDGPFDAVIGSSVLHHLDLTSALPKMYELLRPGGWFSFAEPNMLNPQVWMERHCRSLFPYVSADETAFVRWSFAETLNQIGFTEVEITPFDWLHPSTPGPLIPLVRRIGACLEWLPGLREFSGSLWIRARRPASASPRDERN